MIAVVLDLVVSTLRLFVDVASEERIGHRLGDKGTFSSDTLNFGPLVHDLSGEVVKGALVFE